MQCLHGLIRGISRNNFDFTDDIAIVIDDKTLLVGDLACTFLDIRTFGKLADGFTLFIKDLALLVDFLALKDRKIWRESSSCLACLASCLASCVTSFTGSLASLVSGTINTVFQMLGSVRYDFGSTNNITILVKNLALVVKCHASKVCRVAFRKLAKRISIGAHNVAVLINFKTF